MKKEKLRTFNKEELRKLKKVMLEKKPEREHGPDSFKRFICELEHLIPKRNNFEWEQMLGVDNIVFLQKIGKVYYKHTVHIFEWVCVQNPGLAIRMHSNNELANDGTQIRKGREWYIFQDGTIDYSNKDQSHELVNIYDQPIYVLIIKTKRKGDR